MAELRKLPRLPLVFLLSAILLLAVLSTGVAVHVIWQQAANRSIDSAVASLDSSVGKSVTRTLTGVFEGAEGAAEIIRSALFQGTIDPNEEAKREFLFLSVLRSQPDLNWIGYGFPDGRFFGAYSDDDTIEMVEIGKPTPGMAAPLRRDRYTPLEGDIFFEERTEATSEYVASGSNWFRSALEGAGRHWSVVDILPNGFEPSAVVSMPVERHGEFIGVVMVAVNFSRFAIVLSALEIASQGRAFILGPADELVASSVAGARYSRLQDIPSADRLAALAGKALDDALKTRNEAIIADAASGPAYLRLSKLPFQDWRLFTAIPRTYFASELDMANRYLPYAIMALSMLAAVTSIVFAGLMFNKPLRRLRNELKRVELFDLAAVSHQPTIISELDEFSRSVAQMATGLSSFGKYIPSEVVRLLVASGVEPTPGGEMREVTIMFADLPGFTEMSEKLGPAVEPYLTSFLTLAVDAIHRENGTVDKFIGDEVMAMWNAPGDVSDHAERACRAAIAIRDAIRQIPLPLPGPGSHAVGSRIRIGIHTGLAIVGNVGSSSRLSYTAIGDTVNIASRLVGIAKEFGLEIAVSETAMQHAREKLTFEAIGKTRIRGRANVVAVFALPDDNCGIVTGESEKTAAET